MKHRIPFRVQPMLPTLVPEPFDRSGWAYEEKYDGVRILAYKKRAGSGCSPEMTKTEQKTSLELQPQSGFFNPSLCFWMVRSLSLTRSVFPDSNSSSRIRANRCTPSLIAFFTKAKICGANSCPSDGM